MDLRKFCAEYYPEFIFGIVLLICVLLSYHFAAFIPDSFYNNVLSPILNGCIATVSLLGAIILLRHYDGVHVRAVWAGILLIWVVLASMLLLRVMAYNAPLNSEETFSLRGRELLIGSVYAWLLLIYPTAVLRPGWWNFKRVLLTFSPIILFAAVEYFLHVDIRWVMALYPVVMAACLMTFHARAYRIWCEENYSSMDNIDVQWIWRYMTMYLISGGCYCVMSFSYTPAHAFTQQWLLLFMLAYSTEQILFRQDPWNMIRRARTMKEKAKEKEAENAEPEMSYADYRAILEDWMNTEKPYSDPEFRLLDLRQVLPLNRSYLSDLINTEYGCNFYQFVTNYRIDEAMRLMREQPELKLQDISEMCGFSSPTVFSRIFLRETGMTPREWSSQAEKEIDNSSKL